MAENSGDKVVLTPQLQLAIRMLQGNHLELRGWIKEALADNPALSWEPPQVEAEVDAEVRVGADGEPSVVLADDGVLSVVEDVEDAGDGDGDESEARQRAEWLVSAIARRRRAIERLLEAIVPHQRAFLIGEEPRPAELSAGILAAELGFHRSTVERLLKGKRVRIRRGAGQGDGGSEVDPGAEVVELEALATGVSAT